MRIRKITLENNIVFGTGIVEFDFTKPDGSVYDNILLIGENGSGKSTLLDIIFEFSEFANVVNDRGDIEKRTIEVEFLDKELIIIKTIPEFIDCNNIYIFSFDYGIKNDRRQIKTYSNGKEYATTSLINKSEVKGIFKSIYSTTEINFNGKVPDSITNKDIDELINTSKKSSPNLAIEISQLLMDIRQKDNEEESIYRDRNGTPIDETNRQTRTKRFKNAFNTIFSGKLVYEGIKDGKPNFKKESNEFDITKLSSGEKQIVFRGGYLLKDQNSLTGAPALIDEPEISLHPSWQLKIIEFYRNIFRDTTTDQQTSQIFFTTHSPYVLKSYNPNDFQIYVFQRDDTTSNVTVTGSINLGKMYRTPTWGEVNRYAYKLPTIEFHDELYGYLHDKYINDPSLSPTTKKDRSGMWDFENNYLTHCPFNRKQRDQESYDSSGTLITRPRQVTLQTFIRNKSHHPENRAMKPHDFTIQELQQSIEGMLSLI